MSAAIHAKEVELGKQLKELSELCHTAYNEKEDSSGTLKAINSMHERIRTEQKLSHINRAKLRSLCSQGLTDAETQLEAFKEVLDKIQVVRKLEADIKALRGPAVMRRGVLMNLLQEHARTLPAWVGKPGQIKAQSLVGAIPASSDYVCEVGSRVAALVPESEDGGEEVGESWILAEVVSSSSHTYQVDDIDIEEGKERYSLSKKKVIPLPLFKANPVTNPEAFFDKGRLVLALYPQTTCFYRALVEDSPVHLHDDYSLFFEDSSYPEGYAPPLKIPQKYVIDCPESSKKE